jgi:predicted nucleic-acid-binding protein
MIAIDTNVLVRYLVNDDEKQAERAKHLFDAAANRSDHIFIGCIVLVETVWVLESAYEFTRSEQAEVVTELLAAGLFRFERKEEVEKALDRFRKGKADFSDYLSAEISLAGARSKLHTFDKSCREPDLFLNI